MSNPMCCGSGEGDDMKKAIFGSVVALAWCMANVSGQQQPAPTPEPVPAHKVFVLTGCLTAGGDTEGFKLIDASVIGRDRPNGAAAAGAVGTSGQKETYRLQPVTGVNAEGVDADALKAHAGQRVEVTVRPIEVLAPSTSAANSPTQVAKPIEPAPERFSVTAIKRVTGMCS
jgi:hypothetical protein